jgi:hypothetical protein
MRETVIAQSTMHACQPSSQIHDLNKRLWLIAYGKRKPALLERVSECSNAFRKSLTIL